MLPVVAIVGRPNVGKSTLFNRLLGERQAIVHDEYGVTRDRHYGESFWNGRDFTVIDTGGYLPDKDNVITSGIRNQVELAISEADVIVLVTDVLQGITKEDDTVAELLRKQKKPVVLAVNKSDNQQASWGASEFYKMGFDDLFPVSAISGMGTGEMLDKLVELLPEPVETEAEADIPKIAIVGRPNVGKSSLINSLLKNERCIVTDIAGTTRDSINSKLVFNDREYILVDTAGLRKKSRVKDNIEYYSLLRTEKSIRECDVCVLLVDSVQGFDVQDARLLRMAEQFNKGMVIALNKWDLIEKETNTAKDFTEKINRKVPNLKYVPVITISALTGQRVQKIIDECETVIREREKKITTSKLNTFLKEITDKRPLPYIRGNQLKIKYVTQVKNKPPVFAFFMNSPRDLPANYRRFIENNLREQYEFKGVPITMVFKQK
ncbi:ribosome biogenesis GTPase Der [Balneolaceae bacterium ANBcel3]|nr:ribosome biogenesis GTPase Der [Balneolaceae bacterium ANBcel3]